MSGMKGERQKLIIGSLAIFVIATLIFAYNILTGGTAMTPSEMGLVYASLAVMVPLLFVSYYLYQRAQNAVVGIFLVSMLMLIFLANHLSHRGIRNPATMALVLMPYLAASLVKKHRVYWFYTAVIPILMILQYELERYGYITYSQPQTPLLAFDILAPVLLISITIIHAYYMQKQHDLALVWHKEKTNTEAEVSRLKTAFLASVSHDLRTPLNAIIGFADYIKRHTDREDIGRDAVNILASSQDLLDMVNNILDVSRLQSGKFTVVTKTVSLTLVLETLMPNWALMANNRGLRFDMSIDANYNVEAESRRLRQIFSNLVDNAIQYTASGIVRVFTTYDHEAGEVRVSVSDTGPGLNMDMEDLFTPFIRGRDTGGGAGLGLPLAKGLVTEFNGRIEVDSSDRGTVFTVVLPADVAQTPRVIDGLFSICIIDPHPPEIREKGWHICYPQNGTVPLASIYAINTLEQKPEKLLYPNLVYTKGKNGTGYSPGAVSYVNTVSDLNVVLEKSSYFYALVVGDDSFIAAVEPICNGMTVIRTDPDTDRVAAIARHGDVMLIIRARDLAAVVGLPLTRSIIILEDDEGWGALRAYLTHQPPNQFAEFILRAIWEMAV